MKPLKIKIRKKALMEIQVIDPKMDSKEKIEALATSTMHIAIDMLENALSIINEILDHETEEAIIEAYLEDPVFVRYFGTEELSLRQIKLIRKRLNRAYKRFSSKRTKIKFLPQDFYFSKFKTSYALNGGYFLTPKSFMVLPNWFKKSRQGKAGTFIHETFHDYFNDQHIKTHNKKCMVYGSWTAAKLATQKPKKARRSPENYEQLCEELWRIKLRYERHKNWMKGKKSKDAEVTKSAT